MTAAGIPDRYIQGADGSGRGSDGHCPENCPENLDAYRPEFANHSAEASGGDRNKRRIKYHLRQLQKKAALRRVGPDKGGYWEVIK